MTSPQRSLTRTLAVFGITSVAAGGLLAAGDDPGRKAFGRQTAAWGAVNLVIAGISRLRPPGDEARLRRILLINAGLDLGYVATGGHIAFWHPRLRGHGLAVVLQGAGLFALDALYARRLSRRATRRTPAVRR